MIKWKQANMGLKNFGLDYGNPDFVKYAEAYGAYGRSATLNRASTSSKFRWTTQITIAF